MDENRIDIIIVQFNKKNTDRLLNSLKGLIIPVNMKVNVELIVDAPNKLVAYNEVLRANQALYKVFFDEKIIIKDKDILLKIMQIFNSNNSIAAVGCIGSDIIQTDGTYRFAAKRYGGIVDEHGAFKNWNLDSDIISVKNIEKYFLAVCGKLEPIEENFQSDDYLFTVFIIQLKKNKYKSVVAKKFINSFTYCGTIQDSYNNHDRLLFLKNYSCDVLPLVNILIPTYKRAGLLRIALDSVLEQDYRNIEIIISDDAEDDETEVMIQEYLKCDNRIKYFHNKGKGFGINENVLWLKRHINPNAEYVNWLMDDDIYYAGKISTMVDTFMLNDNVSLVTSYREYINYDGNKSSEQPIPVCNETMRISGEVAGRHMLQNVSNFVGEPTTALIKKSYCDHDDLGWGKNEGEYIIIDFPRWLDLLSKGDLIYIREPFSALRVHDVRDSNNLETNINGIICWLIEINYAWKNKIFLTSEDEARKAIIIWLKQAIDLLKVYNDINYSSLKYSRFQKLITEVTKFLHNGYNLEVEHLL